MTAPRIPNIFKIPELRKKIIFTLTMIAVYRIGAHIPVPGVDPATIRGFVAPNNVRANGAAATVARKERREMVMVTQCPLPLAGEGGAKRRVRASPSSGPATRDHLLPGSRGRSGIRSSSAC